MNNHTNIVRIKAVYNGLQELRDQVVFVGGAVVSLYMERSMEDVRETDDVDIVVGIYSRVKYADLEEKLRAIGFVTDISAGFVGRFVFHNTIVDVMPIEEEILGFSNRWYDEGYKNSILYKIDDLVTIRIFSAPCFLASKLQAFNSRGKNAAGVYDGRLSSDFEDIVSLLAYRRSIWQEITATGGDLKIYLLTELRRWSDHPYFEEWIDAQTSYYSPVAHYRVMPEIRKLLDDKN